MYIKICGITNFQDAITISETGVDALGFVFYSGSKRYISPDKANEIIKELPPFINTVGLFVNEKRENVIDILHKCPVDILQFHGDESPEYCSRFNKRIIKAFRVKNDFSNNVFNSYSVNAFLLDGFTQGEYGGTGVSFDWDIALMSKKFGRIIIAGGLNPENIESALRKINPYGIDVSSGVEIEPGKKNINKVKEIVKICKNFF